MDLTTLMTIVGCFAAMIAVIITLFLYLGNKTDGLQASIYLEMKDFHGRLCAIESERRVIELERKDQENKFLIELKELLINRR